MKLTQQQIDDFNREGWLFLPELFRAEEVELLAREADASTTPSARRCGSRRAARRALLLPPISTTRRSAFLAHIRA